MMNYKISLAGDLGSGKTTVGEILTEKYNLTKVSVGKILREVAEKQGMTVAEFNKFMETHPEYDRKVDEQLKTYEHKNGNFLFDSRLAWHFVPSSFKVYMTVDVETAANRIILADRQDEKYEDVSVAVQKLKDRRKSEIIRYKTLYGVDIGNFSNYDLVVDTNGKTPSEVAEIIIENFEKSFDRR